MSSEKIYNVRCANSCFFRSVPIPPDKKMILQITEKCNMNCTHCFVSSTGKGRELECSEVKDKILPFFLKSNIKKVTLTGGEPLTHPGIYEIIKMLNNNRIHTTICTNGSLIKDDLLEKISVLSDIHFNVSLDGFSTNSYDRFRGNKKNSLFYDVVSNIKAIANLGLLNGILVTPNAYTDLKEYEDVCKFAIEIDANYILLNPLSEFGRGNLSMSKALSRENMIKLRNLLLPYSEEIELLFIRFPNEKLPLGKCIAGEIPYIFTNGDVAICPYMVFASRNQQSKYEPNRFVIGNVLNSKNSFEEMMESFHMPLVENHKCDSCLNNSKCGRGCLASKIAKGALISDLDSELCPSTQEGEKYLY